MSIISCWEIAKAVEKQKLSLSCGVDAWLDAALLYPGVQLIDLTLPIVIESTRLAGFHRDPGDRHRPIPQSLKYFQTHDRSPARLGMISVDTLNSQLYISNEREICLQIQPWRFFMGQIHPHHVL